jgi:hypothetical protein
MEWSFDLEDEEVVFGTFMMLAEKGKSWIISWGLSYKTFHGRNLRIFVTS